MKYDQSKLVSDKMRNEIDMEAGDYGAFSNGNEDNVLQELEHSHRNKSTFRKRLLYNVICIILVIFMVLLIGRSLHFVLRMIKEHSAK